MLFQSPEFLLVFLPVVVVCFYALRNHQAPREWLLIVASGVFYAWWDARFLPVMMGQAIGTWLIARTWPASRAALIWAVALNLLVLSFFKYTNFLVANMEALLGTSLPRNDIILPIGISFYTFALLSYVIDRKRGEAPLYGVRRFLLFVLYFPHLIAGPIVRHWELIPQLDLHPCRDGMWERLSRGALLLSFGLVKKVALADPLAVIADPIFSASATAYPTFSDAWTGAVAFTLQLYFDFSAYSDMAIGMALMMGIRFPDNFNSPYKSVNIQEFWRRWHMSLSRLFRDYVYIPLGGSRSGAVRYVMATLLTFGLCGLWHGAGWTFILWGLLHGVGLVVHRFYARYGFALPSLAGWAITMTFVIFGWVLFRATDFTMAANIMTAMVFFEPIVIPAAWPLLMTGVVVVLLLPRAVDVALESAGPSFGLSIAGAAAFCLTILIISSGKPASFIYFQF